MKKTLLVVCAVLLVASLAVAGAEKILQREVNAQAHSDLLKQLREQLR